MKWKFFKKLLTLLKLMNMDETNVIEAIRSGKVFMINPYHFRGRFMTQQEMIAIFDQFDAFWKYEGEPCEEKPHAILKSGLHSNGFISCKEVLQYPALCTLFANEMVKHASNQFLKTGLGCVDVVVSSAYSAINIGFEIARLISEKHNPKVEYVVVEKDQAGNPTNIRGSINPNKRVLVVNELMTTGDGSTWETKKAVQTCNGEGNPMPEILEPSFVLVHRSNDLVLLDGSKVYPVFHFDIVNFKPEECPYCKVGSKAIKPKVDQNWKLLHS